MKIALYTLMFLYLVVFNFPSFAANQKVTLKQKIGQMLIVGFRGTTIAPQDTLVDAIDQQQIGGVILYDYDTETNRHHYNIENAKQLTHLTSQLQNLAKRAANKHHNDLIPLFITIDYEGGLVNRLHERYGFPKTLTAKQVSTLSKQQRIVYAKQMAKTLHQLGINLNFAPVLDVDFPNNPIISRLERSFSSNAFDIAYYASSFSKAYKEYGIACVYKHFPGHGNSVKDSHEGFVDITKTWQPFELLPYQILLQNTHRCPLIMTAHVVHYQLDPQGHPASLSKAITTDLLRKQLHYDGLIITDDLQMKAIADHYGYQEAIKLAINSGADILIFSNPVVSVPYRSIDQNPQHLIDTIVDLVTSGQIPKERIEESFNRIIQLKRSLAHSH